MAAGSARAAGRAPTEGRLFAGRKASCSLDDAFQKALRELGYEEGKNLFKRRATLLTDPSR